MSEKDMLEKIYNNQNPKVKLATVDIDGVFKR